MTTVQMGNPHRYTRNHSVLRNPTYTTSWVEHLPCDKSTRRDQIGYRVAQLTVALANAIAVSMMLVGLLR